MSVALLAVCPCKSNAGERASQEDFSQAVQKVDCSYNT